MSWEGTGFTLDSIQIPGRRRKSAGGNVEARPIIASEIDKAIGWARRKNCNDMLARNLLHHPHQRGQKGLATAQNYS